MKFLPLISFMLIYVAAYGQITIPAVPQSEQHTVTSDYPTYRLPFVDVDRYKAEDAREDKGLPPRFGATQKVNYNLREHGTWEQLPNGDRIWRMRVVSENAYSLNFQFRRFFMPEGGQLFLYNDDRSAMIGALTDLNNKSDRKFATAPLKGEAVIFEYYEPLSVKGQGAIELESAVHAYQNLFETAAEIAAKGFGDSGSCNNDVACAVSAGWESDIRSVALIIVNGSRSCSGAMVNNTANDGTPYFLTANHCSGGLPANTNLNNWVFVFNYQSSSCSGGDGTLNQSITGGQIKANFGDSDFCLIELSNIPPPAYGVFYAGWDNSNSIAPNSTGIHHPAGDVKKISFNNDALVSSYGLIPGVPDTHWQVTEWEDGTTEGGSSGSPLFDQNHRVIGQLHGGTASCGSITEDEYGKFSMSWVGGGTPTTRLSNYLDPNGTGQTSVDGFFPNLNAVDYDLALTSVDFPVNFTCDLMPEAELSVTNLGTVAINNFSLVYRYDSGSPQVFNWTGTLNQFAATGISLPATTLTPGAHTLEAFVTMPNGNVDQENSNDTLSVAFDAIIGEDVTVDVLADLYPAEISYVIQNLAGDTLFERNSGFAENMVTSDVVCLPQDCYVLTISDAFGDGMSVAPIGSLDISWNGTNIGSLAGDAYTTSASLSFCIPVVSTASFSFDGPYCVGEDITPNNFSILASSYNWTMSGASITSSTDTTPTFSYSTAGVYTVDLSMVGTDGNTYNVSETVEVTSGSIVTVDLLTDNYPSETSYRIEEQTTGNLIAEQNGFTAAGVNDVENYCLADGCYYFIIEDSYGDGICCGLGAGSYSVIASDGSSYGTGGEFLFSDTVVFCVTPNLIIDVAPEVEVTIFPNPTTQNVNLEFAKTPESIEVLDVMGRSLFEVYPEWNTAKLSLADYPNGVFFVKLRFEEGIITKKIVLER